MPVLEAQITHPDGTTETLELTELDVTEQYRDMDVAIAYAIRDDVNDLAQVNEGADTYLLTVDGEDEFEGVLEDIQTVGSKKELVIESNQRKALDAQPLVGAERWEGAADADVITDALGDVDGLSAGTIENVESGLTFVFAHTSPAKRIKTVAESTGAELAYRVGGTVDYVGELGSDKTATEISPAAGTVEDEMEIDVDGAEQYTHLRVVGAGEGEHQRWANVVPEADTSSYENAVTYTNADWDDGDPEIWGSYSNKDFTDQSTLESWGVALMEESQVEHITVKAKVRLDGETVSRGDSFRIKQDTDDFDEELRVYKVTRQYDAEGTVYDTTFSNHIITPGDRAEQTTEDVDKYNLAFEGDSVWATPGGSRQPIDPNTNYNMWFRLPDETEYIHRFQLQVATFPYRFYASPVEHHHTFELDDHSHDVVGDSHSHPLSMNGHEHGIEYEDEDGNTTEDEHAHVVEIETTTDDNTRHEYITSWHQQTGHDNTGGDWEVLGTFGIEQDWEFAYVNMTVTRADAPVRGRVAPFAGGNYFPREDGAYMWGTSDDSGTGTLAITIPEQMSNFAVEYESQAIEPEGNIHAVVSFFDVHQHEVATIETSEVASSVVEQVTTGGTASASATGVAVDDGGGTAATSGETAGMEPGIEDTTETAEELSVVVNGTTVEEDIGSGVFREEVDMLPHIDEFNFGGWNEIEVECEGGLGHVLCQADIDLYRQILGDG